MILQNCEIIASVSFLLIVKIVCFSVRSYREMYNKSSALSSIPEINEEEEIRKWVPKKRHEVLKAKYKCLKKLFQIYDASVIGILPEANPCQSVCDGEGDVKKRHKRSHRTKTDASAGTSEVSSGDITEISVSDKGSTIDTSVIGDQKKTEYSCTSTQIHKTKSASTQNSKISVTEDSYPAQSPERLMHPVPYLMLNEKPKLTRFQCFIQRIFGLRKKSGVMKMGHVYAASDNNIERRRRRGLRFRRLRRPKKAKSEGALVKDPMIMSYMQYVQKNCLTDTTPRQCPIIGCKTIFYGIINYNDHLNLCHFKQRKHVCHYCHEGFEREYDKYFHESEHIGISKLNSSLTTDSSSGQSKKAIITQTEPEVTTNVQEDKLKRIFSFFEKISDPDQLLSGLKRNRRVESSIHNSMRSTGALLDTSNNSNSASDSGKRTVSCGSLPRKGVRRPQPAESEVTSKGPCTSVTCSFCGENFECRRQLSLHVDLEHRVHDKYSKFHSCAGIVGDFKDGKTEFKTVDRSSKISVDMMRRKSEDSLSYEPSTNIVYTSTESVQTRKPIRYQWRPGTAVVRT